MSIFRLRTIADELLTLYCRFLINSHFRRVHHSIACLKNNNEKLHFAFFCPAILIVRYFYVRHFLSTRRCTQATQRVLRTGTRKFDRSLGQILHDQLHWLDVPDMVLFKLAVTVHQCLNGRAPPYLSEHGIPVSSADTRRHLRSANRHLLAVPRFRLNTCGRRAFSVVCPIA